MTRAGYAHRLLFAAAASLFSIVPSAAAECLDFLATKGWSAVPAKRHTQTMVWLGIRNSSDNDIVMIEGTANFVDALGNAVEPFPMALPPDLHIPANDSEIADLWLPGVNRLTSIDFDLVTESICVTGIVTSDGKVIRAGE